MSDAAITRVFDELLCNASVTAPESFGVAAFASFDALFRRLNVAGGKLTSSAIVAPQTLSLADVRGLAPLWEIALRARADRVRRAAAYVLVQLHTQFAPASQLPQPVDTAAVWTAFVEQTLGRISAMLASP